MALILGVIIFFLLAWALGGGQPGYYRRLAEKEQRRNQPWPEIETVLKWAKWVVPLIIGCILLSNLSSKFPIL